MKKIAFINQRYGLEVNGGSEYYTRLIAEQLKEIYQVEILTTKALDYVTWENYYKEDCETINGVTVKRFEVEQKRDLKRFSQATANVFQKINPTDQDEQKWVDEQGPYCPALINYIMEHEAEYDLFIFVTYLYYTTCIGITKVWNKAVLIPTAHDEPYINMKIYKDVFCRCKAIVYLTDEEKALVERKFHNQDIPNVVTAIGIEAVEKNDLLDFQQVKGINNYIIYVGRIDELKGCKWLFQYFIEYKKRNHNDLKLVLMGKAVMDVPKHDDIISLGFVSEEDKLSGISGAKALILPSHFESLSISVLEAFEMKTPVVVNGQCEVLKGHCLKSNAGLYYYNYFEFEGCINFMLKHKDICEIMSGNGYHYVDEYFRWDIVVEKVQELFDKTMELNI